MSKYNQYNLFWPYPHPPIQLTQWNPELLSLKPVQAEVETSCTSLSQSIRNTPGSLPQQQCRPLIASYTKIHVSILEWNRRKKSSKRQSQLCSTSQVLQGARNSLDPIAEVSQMLKSVKWTQLPWKSTVLDNWSLLPPSSTLPGLFLLPIMLLLPTHSTT